MKNAAVGAALLAVAVAAVIISGDTQARPFNSVSTKRADAGVVRRLELVRTSLSDGGTLLMAQVWVDVPTSVTLPDGGVRVRPSSLAGVEVEPRGAVLNQLNNFLDGPALTGALRAHDLDDGL